MPLKSILSVQVFKGRDHRSSGAFSVFLLGSILHDQDTTQEGLLPLQLPSASTILSLLLNFFVPLPFGFPNSQKHPRECNHNVATEANVGDKIALFDVHLVRVEDNKANNSCLS
ncbi:hypothetical protein CEXT_507221 [Caerostris extrusa]|uniref:Uncharacterized protein n=1 Tax=Caerostris extrusa TaxID=172846 RepID=A0AAV4W8M6_CAEEX|nr:hypothetical protein CEXT_507221 [Caerostris extrusa]